MHVTLYKQFSVFLENRVGALSELCKLISDYSINLLAVCAIDTVEEAVLRIVAENEEQALEVLQKAGFKVIETEIFLIELDNTPGATGGVASRLAKAGINIDYVYASAHPDCAKAYLALRTHEMDETQKILMGGDQ